MKNGISWATIAGAGLALILVTPSVRAVGKEPTFKVRPDRSSHMVAHNTPRPKLASSKPGKGAHKGANPGVGAVPEDISPEAAEVVWLYHHGFSDDELRHYVIRSHADFKMSVDDVNYLKDIGISTDVIVAMARPAQARENVARMRERLPGWAKEALFSKGKPGEHKAAEPAEVSNEPVNDNFEQYGIPNYYGPSDQRHGYPVPPQGYPYGPGPGYGPGYDYRGYGPGSGYDPYNRYNGYNGYNGYRGGYYP